MNGVRVFAVADNAADSMVRERGRAASGGVADDADTAGAGSEENKFGGEAGFEEGLGSSWCAEMA